MCSTSSASPRWWTRLKRGRKPQRLSEIPFEDCWPLKLKNQVSTRRGKATEAPCLKETLAFITCLKDHNNSHELCLKEGEIVQKCYSNYIVRKEETAVQKKNMKDFEPGKNVKDMDPFQLNRFLSHYPHKLEITHSVMDKFEDINVEKKFGKEKDEWRSKMIKVYGDQHPYTFYVTVGHDFEDMILKIVDTDAPTREARKHEPFQKLKKMSEVDQKAEKEFHRLLTELDKELTTTELKCALEQKKKECAEVFWMFDKIVSASENYFEMEYSDCRKRMAKQVNLQEPVFKEVEKFLAEIEAFGCTELNSLRDRISQWIYEKGLSSLEDIDKFYKWLNDQPFAMTVWSDCSMVLTSKEIRNAFLVHQRDTSNMWSKAFDDVLMLSAKLEERRCNYNLMKFKLEREIFWMSRDYKDNMPELTKIQRHLASFADKKVTLKKELKNLKSEISKEQQRAIDKQKEMSKRVISTRANNKYAHETAVKKFQSVLLVKKEEFYNYLTDIVRGDEFIHEKILGVSWNPINLSHIKPSDDSGAALDEWKTSFELSKTSDTDKEDNFSTAFQILVSSNNFITLLNMMADELGYMLDFSWINYVKEKLELSYEIKWIELFKVFKIDFTEMKKLKEHMKPYCKLNGNHEVVFDIDQAVDGFLNYVWQKRQLASKKVPSAIEHDPLECTSYWSSVKDLIPKTLLWENVEDLLFQYWESLEMRSSLLKEKWNLVAENNEFEKYLENYHKYCTFYL